MPKVAAAREEVAHGRTARHSPSPRPGDAPRDQPWLFRTYAGHSSAAASNALYRTNLARGQTGLSVAFDLPTQTGYDSDHPLAAGEVGRVGVPICALPDMQTLFEGIPLEQTNTSMTINATAPWLLALYLVVAERQGADRARLAGTVQNDVIKEYLARGTYIFPPRPSLKLIEDVIAFTAREMPKWNPINVCSYHLQEAGATPVQELAYALANAIAVLDQVRAGGQVSPDDFAQVVGRISFFVNAGVRFVTEMCKMRAFVELWDEITAARYGVADPKLRRFRYGVQVNSLGLTEQQPENNVYRILLETLAVVLSKRARARAVQLPAWNEALGLPRPWDQQWSLRLQQILAYETDLLEHDDLFDGAPAVQAKVEALVGEARAEIATDRGHGRGARGGRERLHEAAPGGVEPGAARRDRRRQPAGGRGQLLHRDRRTRLWPAATAGFSRSTRRPKPRRSSASPPIARPATPPLVAGALEALRQAATLGQNIMPASIACARAGATTGEWAQTLRAVFGEYRAPTGVSGARAADRRSERWRPCASGSIAWPSGGGGGPRCWSASRGSTVTPTAPSRSRCARATAASRWSTTASG